MRERQHLALWDRHDVAGPDHGTDGVCDLQLHCAGHERRRYLRGIGSIVLHRVARSDAGFDSAGSAHGSLRVPDRIRPSVRVLHPTGR